MKLVDTSIFIGYERGEAIARLQTPASSRSVRSSSWCELPGTGAEKVRSAW